MELEAHARPSLGATQQWKQQDQGEGQVCNLRAGLSHPGHQTSPGRIGQPKLLTYTGSENRENDERRLLSVGVRWG